MKANVEEMLSKINPDTFNQTLPLHDLDRCKCIRVFKQLLDLNSEIKWDEIKKQLVHNGINNERAIDELEGGFNWLRYLYDS